MTSHATGTGASEGREREEREGASGSERARAKEDGASESERREQTREQRIAARRDLCARACVCLCARLAVCSSSGGGGQEGEGGRVAEVATGRARYVRHGEDAMCWHSGQGVRGATRSSADCLCLSIERGAATAERLIGAIGGGCVRDTRGAAEATPDRSARCCVVSLCVNMTDPSENVTMNIGEFPPAPAALPTDESRVRRSPARGSGGRGASGRAHDSHNLRKLSFRPIMRLRRRRYGRGSRVRRLRNTGPASPC